MTDDPRDDVDRALGAGLSSLASTPGDSESVLDSMRPRLRRARTRHRVLQTTAVAATLAVLLGLAAVVSTNPTRNRVKVESPTTNGVSGRTTTPPRPSTTSSSSVPSGSPTSVPTTQVRPVGPATFPPLTSPGATSTVPSAGPTRQTYRSSGGDVVIEVQNSRLTLVSSLPAAGFTAEVHTQKPDDVEVRFRSKQSESRIRVRIVNGRVVPEITEPQH